MELKVVITLMYPLFVYWSKSICLWPNFTLHIFTVTHLNRPHFTWLAPGTVPTALPVTKTVPNIPCSEQTKITQLVVKQNSVVHLRNYQHLVESGQGAWYTQLLIRLWNGRQRNRGSIPLKSFKFFCTHTAPRPDLVPSRPCLFKCHHMLFSQGQSDQAVKLITPIYLLPLITQNEVC
jgi:hypothetical protein